MNNINGNGNGNVNALLIITMMDHVYNEYQQKKGKF